MVQHSNKNGMGWHYHFYLRRTVGPKRAKETGEWRKLHNEKLHLYSSPNTVRIIKSRMRWVRHVERMGE
jgi:hypothetical protein